MSIPLSSEWQVWSSSSRNNCHAVHRSLSSGASLSFLRHCENFFYLVSYCESSCILHQDQTIKSATLGYIDDIWINENLISTEHLRKQLSNYRFVCKDSERLQDGASVLGLQVWGRMGLSDGSKKVKSWTFPMLLTFEACSPYAGNLWVIFLSVTGSRWPPDSSSIRQIKSSTVGMPCSPILLWRWWCQRPSSELSRMIWWRESGVLLAGRWIYGLAQTPLLWGCWWRIMELWSRMHAGYSQTMTPSTLIWMSSMYWWGAQPCPSMAN